MEGVALRFVLFHSSGRFTLTLAAGFGVAEGSGRNRRTKHAKSEEKAAGRQVDPAQAPPDSLDDELHGANGAVRGHTAGETQPWEQPQRSTGERRVV
eukprot:s952_g2.t1